MWTWRWRGAMSGGVFQIRIGGSVQFPPVTRIKSLRTPHKSGLLPKVNDWWGLAKWYLTCVGSGRIVWM